jgi:hypothetical protein
MKSTVAINTESKEYPEMTFEQIKRMVELMNQGISEQEAKEEAMKHD